MRRSEALLATSREAPEAGSRVVALMRRAGLIREFGSGLYGFLPAGERTKRKVTDRVVDAMEACGGQRVSLPGLQYAGVWRESGRWRDFEDEMFTLENRDGQSMCLAPSHEEAVAHLVDGRVRSHDDLPLLVYQVTEKYRDDHARNGLLRCKAFTMKDAYSLHATEESLDRTYREVRRAYERVFDDLGLDVVTVPVDDGVMGGSASEEFVAPVDEGSDDLVHCTECRFGATEGSERFDSVAGGDDCPDCGARLAASEGIEVGHVFKLGTRYSDPLDLTVDAADGDARRVLMGSYGLGVTRVVQTLVQQHGATAEDGSGLRWPVTDWGCVAPVRAAIIPLEWTGDHGAVAEEIYEACGTGVLLYDGADRSIGECFAESDLLGVPAKVVIGNHYDRTGAVELEYADGSSESVAPDAVPDALSAFGAGDTDRPSEFGVGDGHG